MIPCNDNDTSNSARTDYAIKVENFRPNIVLSRRQDAAASTYGAHYDPYVEDSWSLLSLPLFHVAEPIKSGAQTNMLQLTHAHDVQLQVTGPCTRCTLVDIDQQRGIRSNCGDAVQREAVGTYKVLRNYRVAGNNTSVYFGQFLSILDVVDSSLLQHSNQPVLQALGGDNNHYFIAVNTNVRVKH